MAAKRRMGPENAAMRSVLLDAAEAVMRERGYAALSARNVAARAGLKYQILFYYFATMDDLLLAAYRRLMQDMWTALEQCLDGDRPLHALWEMWSHPANGAVWLEFMAAANHNPALREEKVAFAHRMRALIVERLKGRYDEGSATVFTPFALSTVLACIGGAIAVESGLGMAEVHRETRTLVEWSLAQLEPARPDPDRLTARKRAGPRAK